MDKLSAKFLIEIKDTFELVTQEQGRKHLQVTSVSHFVLM